jgi:hypothetical protein
LVVVAVVALAMTVVQGVWIWNHRLLGALDPDESGYIATAFQYHRIVMSDPLALPRAIGGTGTGPLIPLLSVPLLWFGPNDPRTVLLVQPILMGVTAIATAGIARRLAGSGAALVSGVVFLTLPTVVFASQTYWLGLGAACFMALGIWALVASERLTNRWAYAFGACTGAMLLCRTMTLGFLPAMVVAGAIAAGRDKRSLIGLAKALAVAFVVAFPWWFAARHAIFDYLFSYGYGKRAGLFGDGGPRQRFFKRIDAVELGVGATWVWARIVLAASAAATAWRWWRTSRFRGRPPWPTEARAALAIGAAVVLGLAALTSTSNNGVWFELPIIALLVPLVVAGGARAPWPVQGLALVPVAGLAALQLGCSLWLIAPGPEGLPGINTVHRVAQYEYGFEQYDVRFGPMQRTHLRQAAKEWWALDRTVERELRRLAPDGLTVFTFSGNFEMFNSNTVQLAAELRNWTPRLWIPDTVGERADRARYLTPDAYDDDGNAVTGSDGKPIERVLVIARHDLHLFTPDEEVADLDREAVAAGWRVVWRTPIPVGGEVVVMRHPDGP